jgi:hypothetical protein
MDVRLVLVATATAATVATAGHASPAPDTFVDRPFTVSVNAGLSTPLGEYGVAVAYAVAPAITVEAGVGEGFAGPLVAVQARARFLTLDPAHVAIGLGFAEGDYQNREPFFAVPPVSPVVEFDATTVRRAMLTTAELSYEHRTPGGLAVRLYAGVGVVIAGERESGEREDGTMISSGPARGMWNPYAGLSIGYAFGTLDLTTGR